MKKYTLGTLFAFGILGISFASAKGLNLIKSNTDSIADHAELLYQNTEVKVVKIIDSDARSICYVASKIGGTATSPAVSCVIR